MTKAETLLRDPVFQLNLLIWMAKEQPTSGYRVRPLFYELGFRLVYIEQPFPFVEATVRAIEAANLAISHAPEPEMILKRDEDRRALYFEAKASSFRAGDENSKQAYAHLLACGPAFGEVLKPLEKALLCYVVPTDHCTKMTVCLTTLSSELQSEEFAPGEHSVHGLSANGQDIVYSWDEPFKRHCGLSEDSAAVLHQIVGDLDPSPLLLIFSEEDCPNPERSGFYRRVLINQVVATLVCDLNLLSPEEKYTTTSAELLAKTTDGAFKFLGRRRQSNMTRIVRRNIFGRIAEFWHGKNFSPVKQDGHLLEITFKDDLAKSEFLEWLEDAKRTSFSDQMPAEEQQGLPGLE